VTSPARLWHTRALMLAPPRLEIFGEMLAALDGRAIPQEVDVVFTADDLGISEAINRGVAAAVECGPVREASLCVTGRAAAEAARVARALGPELGVGLHLSLTEGSALTGAIPGITRADGAFLSRREVVINCLRGIPDARLITAEIRAQLERLVELGFTATHLNAHQSVHVLPVVRDAVLGVVQAQGIRYVRVPHESALVGRLGSARRWLLARLSRAFVRLAQERRSGFRSLPFVGGTSRANVDRREAFLKTASYLAAPAQEWRVHAHDADDVATLTCPQVARRLAELRVHSRRFADVVR
jgi:predicted glycoside hydrolase/deacetylase ChbG (UPF0249 family)